MADEYIKREDTEKCADGIINHPIEDGFRDSIEILSAIHNLPATDVRPVVHGRWTLFGRRGIYGMLYECSACHAKYDGRSNFCPNCGADMRDRMS